MTKDKQPRSDNQIKFDGELIIAKTGNVRKFYLNDKQYTENEIVEAILKQTQAKKPIWKRYLFPHEPTDYEFGIHRFENPHCPTCYVVLHKCDPHCKECGQLLEWG